jgi:hypothetical protein
MLLVRDREELQLNVMFVDDVSEPGRSAELAPLQPDLATWLKRFW